MPPSAADGAIEQPSVVSDAGAPAQRGQRVVCKRRRKRDPKHSGAIHRVRDVARSDVALDTEHKAARLIIVPDLGSAKAALGVEALRCGPTVTSVRAGIEACPGERRD